MNNLQTTIRYFLGITVTLAMAGNALAAEQPAPAVTKARADEPMAREMSLAKAAEFLDASAVGWTRTRQCGTCHTNFPYLMARPVLGHGAGMKEVRDFFEKKVSAWDADKPAGKPPSPTQVVATATALAINDSLTTGKLQPATRKALDRMWTLQQASGAWNWTKCTWPPFEHDDYFGALYGALAVGNAPDNYARTEQARKGIDNLRGYFRNTPPPNLHHKAWLLWASIKLDDLLDKEQQQTTVKELRALQHADGGWSLPSLGNWKGFSRRPNDKNAPSDGYATGLIIFVLRQAGVPASDPALQRGLAWLKQNQRESGRWFTRSLNTDKAHYISNTATCFAVLAIDACAEKKK